MEEQTEHVKRRATAGAKLSLAIRHTGAAISGVIRAAAAWRWGAPLARGAAGVAGLVVLAAIGRSALARGSPQPAPAATDPAAVVQPLAPPPPPTASAAEPAPAAQPPAAVAAGPAALVTADDAGAGTAPSDQDAGSRSRATPDDPVYLNRATLSDLRRLPGMGPKRAQAVLALRERLGGFHQIEDLLKVKGIGRSSLKKLRPLVRLDGAAQPPAVPGPEAQAATPPPP